MVFQTYALFPHLTVADNIAFGLDVRARARGGDPVKRVAEMLALVRLSGLGDRKPRSCRAASSSAWRWPAR